MFRAFTVTLPCPAGTIDSNPFSIAFRKFFECFEQGLVFPVKTLIGVPHPFSRYIAVVVADILIMFVDLPPDIVQMAVDTVGFDTLAFRTTAFDLPQANWDFDFGAELGNRSIDRNTTHDRSERPFLVPFQVEQNLECTAHNSAF